MVKRSFGRRRPAAASAYWSAASIHIGQSIGARERQEDAGYHRIYDNGESVLILVADGMGGHEGGEIASSVVVESFTSAFFDESAAMRTPQRLAAGLARANHQVAARIGETPELEGMGSTLVAAVASRRGLSWASVGDSLLLRVRGPRVERLNEDHSMAPLLDAAVKKGDLTADQSASHRDRNALRSAVLGSQLDLVDINETPVRLRRGDVLLVASDGLSTLDDAEIAKIVAREVQGGAKAVVDGLLAGVAAKNRRRQDNTTVAVVIVAEESAGLQVAPMYRKRHLVIAAAMGAVLAASALSLAPAVTQFDRWIKKTVNVAGSLGTIASDMIDGKPEVDVAPVQLEDVTASQVAVPHTGVVAATPPTINAPIIDTPPSQDRSSKGSVSSSAAPDRDDASVPEDDGESRDGLEDSSGSKLMPPARAPEPSSVVAPTAVSVDIPDPAPGNR